MQRRARRGSAYVSPVSSSSSSSEEGDEVDTRRAQWSRRRPQVSSSSSSSSSPSSSDEGDAVEEDGDTDALEDFVGARSRASRRRASVAKLDRLRRIFLNQPPAAKQRPKKKKDDDTGNQDAHSTTTSNSSGEHVACTAQAEKEGDAVAATITLAIGHHVAALRDQVQRLARHHAAHAQQWQAALTQAIEELTFVKQREERALQSHARLVQESYALRLEVFEQQYRAKVAEIRDAMRAEIAQQRQQSERAVVAAAQRLEQQTQQLFLADNSSHTNDTNAADRSKVDKSAVLAKTSVFLDRQRAREDARRRRHATTEGPPPVESTPRTAATSTILSPVARQRAKLRALEQKLATFSPETVDRVARTVEQHTRARRARLPTTPPTPTSSTVVATATATAASLRAAPLSPLRRRESYWHNGVSREEPAGAVASDQALRPRPPLPLSRRFLRPEEERELRTLRNRIGLATDWMAQHT